jgi:hypothetical protein
MYFQTTPLSQLEFWRAMENAKRQEDRVAALYARYGAMSPSEVLRRYIAAGYAPPPLTSIRRAVTVLTEAGALVRTDETVIGSFGAREHVWKPADRQSQAAA